MPSTFCPHHPPARRNDQETLAQIALTQVRLPRPILALLAGAAPGARGALLQDILSKPLASPELLGDSRTVLFGLACTASLNGLLVPDPRAPHTMRGTPVLEVRMLTVGYGQRPVLQDVSTRRRPWRVHRSRRTQRVGQVHPAPCACETSPA